MDDLLEVVSFSRAPGRGGSGSYLRSALSALPEDAQVPLVPHGAAAVPAGLVQLRQGLLDLRVEGVETNGFFKGFDGGGR